MTEPTASNRASFSSFLSGVVGGLVVLVLGAILFATGAIDTGENTTRVVREGIPVRQLPDADGARTVSEIYRREGAGVVFVRASGVSGDSPFGFPQQRQGTATGSGFVVDRDGTIITNQHVVNGASEVQVRFGEDDDFVDADVVGQDASTDLAVIKVDPDDAKLSPLPLGNSRRVQVGDPVIAIGNPFGFSRTVTTGIVSALARQIEAPNGFPIRNILQTDASINPGNSGGPLLDADGRVIGINSQIATGGSQGSVGIGFAVPIDTAKELLPQLKKGGEVERAYLGIEMAAVTDQVARDLNLPVKRGALITGVTDGGPADDAGLRSGRTSTSQGIVAGGDIITEVAGEKVDSPDEVAEAIAAEKPGTSVEITYYRGRDERTTKVKLGKRPTQLQTGSQGQAPDPEDLFPQLP